MLKDIENDHIKKSVLIYFLIYNCIDWFLKLNTYLIRTDAKIVRKAFDQDRIRFFLKMKCVISEPLLALNGKIPFIFIHLN